MTKIFKYKLPDTFDAIFTLPLPMNALIVAVNLLNDFPYIWAMVDEDGPVEDRIFKFFATGEPIIGYNVYVGTFYFTHISEVWHLFEVV